ncbi:hypothetical protein [Parasitella parasitica]|uniref:C2H2-type domain-containing protein n=1 Tax=Parasitella parasitica TaxID=35722 RepID=A0A0B7N4C0_9FUNG|nr:hypothetical protein [Parasitella parasitica]
MAHAIFNVSPVKFLTSIQDHVFTVTPSFKNKLYRHNNVADNQEQTDHMNSSSSPVTLQLTLPTDSTMDQQLSHQLLQQQQQQQQEMTEIPSSSLPIDIPRSYPLNVPNTTDYSEGLGLIPNNSMLSTSYTSQHSPLHDNHNLIALANSIPNNNQSPYLPADDLTLCFDGLAVKSPTGSYYSHQNGVYSPQQINSPVNIGSPRSPIYFGSPQSPNSNFLANEQQYSFVGSPNSAQFLGSPALTPFMSENGFGAYLSPVNRQQHLSPINSPSPTGSYVGQNYLFPPASMQAADFSRPSSPVPDDVILTTSEINDFMNSPYLSPSIVSNSASPAPIGQPSNVNYSSGGDNDISELLFSNTTNTEASDNVTPASPLTTSYLDNMELYPFVVKQSSPQAQTETQTYAQPQEYVISNEGDAGDREHTDENGNTTILNKSTKKITPSGRKAKIHKCPYCHHTSNRANNMREHIQIHDPNRPKPHACKLCSRPFARKHDMNRHYLSCKKQHAKQYKPSTSNNQIPPENI